MYKPYDKLLDNITYICCLIVLAGGLIVIPLFHFYNINLDLYRFPCALNLLTGYYCPGCGGTRALKHFLSGHILKSLYYHPIVAYAIIPGIWFTINQTIYRIHKKRYGDKPYKILTGRFAENKFLNLITRPATVRTWYVYAGIALLLIQCIVKNILHAATGFSL